LTLTGSALRSSVKINEFYGGGALYRDSEKETCPLKALLPELILKSNNMD
jgi:hypothetical protein